MIDERTFNLNEKKRKGFTFPWDHFTVFRETPSWVTILLVFRRRIGRGFLTPVNGSIDTCYLYLYGFEKTLMILTEI